MIKNDENCSVKTSLHITIKKKYAFKPCQILWIVKKAKIKIIYFSISIIFLN